MTIEEARAILPIAPELWRRLNIPGEPKAGRNCFSPFRDERDGSFSISKDGQLWHDFGTGEGGNAVHFLAKWLGVSVKTAVPKLVEMAGGRMGFLPKSRPIPRPKLKPERPLPKMPPLRGGTDAEFRQLGKVRNLNPEILKIAHKRGFLFFAACEGQPAWLLTDGTRKLAQARRSDGSKWKTKDGESKVLGFTGNRAKWPIGAEESRPFERIAFVEGGPDLLAAIQYCWAESRLKEVAVMAMLGTCPIEEEALPTFEGKSIRIFPHCDTAGREAAGKWAVQLQSVGAEVDGFSFEGLRMTNGEPVRDFNDMTSIDPDSYESLVGDLMP